VSPIRYVGSATASGNKTSHTVTLPATVQSGDGLLLMLATNSTATVAAPTGVTGWTQAGAVSTVSSRSVLWRKVATAADAGRNVTVTVSSISKANLVILAYRGTAPGNPLALVASAADAAGSSRHVTPQVTVADSRSWVVSWWTHKDSVSTSLVAPPGVTVRSNAAQTGSGMILGLVADGNGPAGAGVAGGLAATAAGTASNAHVWSIVLAPA
jgi:hypothetical protein